MIRWGTAAAFFCPGLPGVKAEGRVRRPIRSDPDFYPFLSPSHSGARGLGSTTQAGAMSRFGRFIAFTSLNQRVVGEDDNPWQDVFVRDRVHSTHQQIRFPGTSGPRLAFAPALSTDGRFVAWYEQPVPQSPGSSLTTNIYWMDRENGLARTITFGGTTFPSSPPFPNSRPVRNLVLPQHAPSREPPKAEAIFHWRACSRSLPFHPCSAR